MLREREQVADQTAAADLEARREAFARAAEREARANMAEIEAYRDGQKLHASEKRRSADAARLDALRLRQQQVGCVSSVFPLRFHYLLPFKKMR